MRTNCVLGIDKILSYSESFKKCKIALASNAASLCSNGIHSRIVLLKSGFNIIKLFAPEHGFDGTGEDGLYIDHQQDTLTQLPIISLYGDRLAPTFEDLEEVDCVFIDLPDIGTRFYTYLWTMSYILESCEKYSKKVFILDRPNPMAQHLALAEGPILNDTCSSFIGRYPIPVTHQCTFGELAQYFKAMYYPDLQLEVIKIENWNRTENNFTFNATSPAIQKIETIFTYPGACLFEGLNINEGRGSAYPFSQFGAPWIDSNLLYDSLKNKYTSVKLEIVNYIPDFGLYQGQQCHGLRIIPINPQTFQSFDFFLNIIYIINDLFPSKLEEKNYLTNANPNGTKHLDKLIGIPNSFELIKSRKINSKLESDEWLDKITPYLLY